ncbi:MAG: protein-L-isoaspartate(D-aspartate) O-methyltransferase [Thiobacillaceae bacterium]|nr:protein-L-isoaspartate(D-aspartate) O-methyltransferase [Thiobacillaceae bacterium]MCX7673997.1 protein-L-isoaspartate(D-aspartate) O-methyltransferase [Thiobacillaceae bacterium]MDW8322775.1 protein-L-isoaspartate(D-aspartate) O-methyltransferase [Burkholderiales bacterium]
MRPLDGIGMTSQRTRARMVERLRQEGIKDAMVLAAMNEIPRHLFVQEGLQTRAYEDTPLPIGEGQTISSPYTVARSCELAVNGRMLDTVLEIGGGCGYQAAVLSRLAKKVVSLERIAKLVGMARQNLDRLRIRNVLIKVADGSRGYPRAAPYDAIIVAAAMPFIPPELIAQLKPGGRLIAPVGQGEEQRLTLVERGEAGPVEQTLESVRFVPLVSGVA